MNKSENQRESNEHDSCEFANLVVIGIMYWLAGCLFAGVFTYIGAERLAKGGMELAGLMLFTIPITGAASAVALRLLVAASYEARWTRSYRVTFVGIALAILTGVVWFSHAFDSFSPTPQPVGMQRAR
ncbi:MAG: hypothetical protein EAZ24_07445 [Burkholderiales bacterium]|nr:MAG: hypothetical protein EAZ24_07445 [Burkholderiales bacterium]